MIVVAAALCRRSTCFDRLALSRPTERRRYSRFSTNLRGFEITSARHSSEYEHDYEHEHEC
jgi:hypothetical protein